MMLAQGTVLGHCQSKANSRRIFRGRSIKSAAAMQFETVAIAQLRLQAPKVPIECQVRLDATIYYPSQRNDLDESLFMDCLQKAGVIKNDRQIREKIIRHGIDKESPCVVWSLSELL